MNGQINGRKPRYAQITGWGMYVPERVVTNDDISRLVDTTDEWIRSMTGIPSDRRRRPRDDGYAGGSRRQIGAEGSWGQSITARADHRRDGNA
jgi:hypothetical protein